MTREEAIAERDQLLAWLDKVTAVRERVFFLNGFIAAKDAPDAPPNGVSPEVKKAVKR